MSQWVPQNECSSVTPAARSRTAYLQPVLSSVIDVVDAYVRETPDGEEVTLAVMSGIGRARLEVFASGRTFDRVKQDLGLLVALTLVDLYGALRVQTLRREDRKGTSTRRCARPELSWVGTYAPHRVLPAVVRVERILLDTTIVRQIIHGDPKALDLGALGQLKRERPVSIADGALAELADYLLRHPQRASEWANGISGFDDILDPDFPVAPGGRELASMWGAHTPVGMDLGEARAYYRAAWRYLRGVKEPNDLSRQEVFEAPSGRAYALGPLDPARVEAVLARAGEKWTRWVSVMSELIASTEREEGRLTEFELQKLAFSNLCLDMGVADAAKLDLVTHVLAKRAKQAATGKTPYNPKGEHNDAVDLDLLFGIPLPAWVVTADSRLHRLVHATDSKDKASVMTTEELLARLKDECGRHSKAAEVPEAKRA